jgi:hypothetical protein
VDLQITASRRRARRPNDPDACSPHANLGHAFGVQRRVRELLRRRVQSNVTLRAS